MDFLYVIFYGCLRLRFLDVETKPGPCHPAPAVCRILCSNVWGLAGNLVTWPWLCLRMIYCCALRLWFQICIRCRRCWFPVSVTLSCMCRYKTPRAHGMAAYIRDGYRAFCQPKFECGCYEMLVFRVCGMRQNLYVYSLYCNPDLDDWIFDCLLSSMAAVQAEDVCASFL